MDVSSPWHIWNDGVLEWTQQATRSLTVSGTHRQAELFSRQQCYFRLLNNISRFYNRDTGALSDVLAPIRDVWERCVQLISRKVNPEPEVTVGAPKILPQGKCSLWRYMSSNPGKYYTIWFDTKTSYAWNWKYGSNLTRDTTDVTIQ